MGIVNVTPDSFSDGGHYVSRQAAIDHAHQLISQGAQIIDIGGESTRPGAQPVSTQTEIDRVLPVLEALRQAPVALSIDTRNPDVMQAALEAGADMINDIQGFSQASSRQVVQTFPQCGLCIMHMQGQPQTMQSNPHYNAIVPEVAAYLAQAAQTLIDQGVDAARIAIDPGFGFGKSVEHNYALLAHLDQLVSMPYPVLVGLSRKSMIGHVLNKTVDQRMVGSVAAALLALEKGAMILRVHDVEQTHDALKIWQAVTAQACLDT